MIKVGKPFIIPWDAIVFHRPVMGHGIINGFPTLIIFSPQRRYLDFIFKELDRVRNS